MGVLLFHLSGSSDWNAARVLWMFRSSLELRWALLPSSGGTRGRRGAQDEETKGEDDSDNDKGTPEEDCATAALEEDERPARKRRK